MAKKSPLIRVETPYIGAQTLLVLLASYKKPREAILRMCKNQELIRLKNGFFLIAEKIQNGVPYEQVANFLYGPSYVSKEWALSFYGVIPEKVYTVTSMTLGKNKEFHTPIGDFSYDTLSEKCYSIGVTLKKCVGFEGNFFLATPEKALADLVSKTCKGLSNKELEKELIESFRMDPDKLSNLDMKLMGQIAEEYRSKTVDLLLKVIGNL